MAKTGAPPKHGLLVWFNEVIEKGPGLIKDRFRAEL